MILSQTIPIYNRPFNTSGDDAQWERFTKSTKKKSAFETGVRKKISEFCDFSTTYIVWIDLDREILCLQNPRVLEPFDAAGVSTRWPFNVLGLTDWERDINVIDEMAQFLLLVSSMYFRIPKHHPIWVCCSFMVCWGDVCLLFCNLGLIVGVHGYATRFFFFCSTMTFLLYSSFVWSFVYSCSWSEVWTTHPLPFFLLFWCLLAFFLIVMVLFILISSRHRMERDPFHPNHVF